MANKHLPHDLKQMQSLPLEAKIIMTQQRIRQWHEYWDGMVYVSFSGGKDSTVLKHIVDGMYDDVPAVFVNTGLEYPEIQTFVRAVKAGKFECFNPNVEIVRPDMRFDEVIKKYGYPVATKRIADTIEGARRNPTSSRMQQLNGQYGGRTDGKPSKFNCQKWRFLLDAPFPISAKCCDIMKKKPIKRYAKQSNRHPIIGILAGESETRKRNWFRNGCNAFNTKDPSSRPLSFWTEQDVLHYIKKYDVPYCPVYGEIQVKPHSPIDGQIDLIDYLGDYTDEDILQTTGCNRTGCIFCMFGCHLEKEPNRFQSLKQTHPPQYQYCIGGGEDVEGKWQPSKEGLGLGKVLDYIGVPYD